MYTGMLLFLFSSVFLGEEVLLNRGDTSNNFFITELVCFFVFFVIVGLGEIDKMHKTTMW